MAEPAEEGAEEDAKTVWRSEEDAKTVWRSDKASNHSNEFSTWSSFSRRHFVAAQEKVSRLEAAIAVLGDHPDPSVLKTLEDALHKAKAFGGRSVSCAQFVERARRRLAKGRRRIQPCSGGKGPMCNRTQRVWRVWNLFAQKRLFLVRPGVIRTLLHKMCVSSGGHQGSSGRGRHVESGHCFRGRGGVGSEEKPHSCATHSDGHCQRMSNVVKWFSLVESREVSKLVRFLTLVQRTAQKQPQCCLLLGVA